MLGLDAHQAIEILLGPSLEEYWELQVEIQCSLKVKLYKYFCIIDKKYLMAPSLIVMVREAVVVSATH